MTVVGALFTSYDATDNIHQLRGRCNEIRPWASDADHTESDGYQGEFRKKANDEVVKGRKRDRSSFLSAVSLLSPSHPLVDFRVQADI